MDLVSNQDATWGETVSVARSAGRTKDRTLTTFTPPGVLSAPEAGFGQACCLAPLPALDVASCIYPRSSTMSYFFKRFLSQMCLLVFDNWENIVVSRCNSEINDAFLFSGTSWLGTLNWAKVCVSYLQRFDAAQIHDFAAQEFSIACLPTSLLNRHLYLIWLPFCNIHGDHSIVLFDYLFRLDSDPCRIESLV